MWCETGRLSISCSHSTLCVSELSIFTFHHSLPHCKPPVFLVTSFVFPSKATYYSFIHSFLSPLCVLCSPLIYCWTCLQNDPGAFHSIKEENKDSSSKRKSTFGKEKKKSVWCILLHQFHSQFIVDSVEQWWVTSHNSDSTLRNRTAIYVTFANVI